MTTTTTRKQKEIADLWAGVKWHNRYTNVHALHVDRCKKNIRKRQRKPRETKRSLKPRRRKKTMGSSSWKFHEYTLEQYVMDPTSPDSACIHSAKKAGSTDCTTDEFMVWWQKERLLKIKTLGQLRFEAAQAYVKKN